MDHLKNPENIRELLVPDHNRVFFVILMSIDLTLMYILRWSDQWTVESNNKIRTCDNLLCS